MSHKKKLNEQINVHIDRSCALNREHRHWENTKQEDTLKHPTLDIVTER